MKGVRDIRLPGIGFIAGMTLCCFVALAEHPIFIGSIAADRKTAPIALSTNGTEKAETIWHVTNGVIKPHTPMLAPGIQDQKPGKVVEIDLNLLNWNQGFIPNLNERRMRIEPALKIKSAFPGGVPQYDLIDLNYQPDFKLPPQ